LDSLGRGTDGLPYTIHIPVNNSYQFLLHSLGRDTDDLSYTIPVPVQIQVNSSFLSAPTELSWQKH
jgi:hypothetical protein